MTKILVWGTPRLGDVVMAFPALKLIRGQLGDARIVWITTDYSRPLVELSELADEIWTFTYRARLLNRVEFLRLRRAIRRARFDQIFIFGDLEKYRRFLGHPDGAHYPSVSETGLKVVRNARVVTKALNISGGDIPDSSLQLNSGDGAEKLVERGLRSGTPYLVMHPGCSYLRKHLWTNKLTKGNRPPKFWPADHYVRLVTNLHDLLPEYGFVIVGSREEQSIVEQKIVRPLAARPKVYNLCGQTNLNELLQILKHGALLVCGDSGVMHLATTTRTPMVALFRSTEEAGSQPWTKPELVRLIRPPSGEQRDPMSCISVESVQEQVLTLLQHLQGASRSADPQLAAQSLALKSFG